MNIKLLINFYYILHLVWAYTKNGLLKFSFYSLKGYLFYTLALVTSLGLMYLNYINFIVYLYSHNFSFWSFDIRIWDYFFTYGIDGLSIGLIFLTTTIFPLCLLYVGKRSDRNSWAFYLLLTEVLIILSFLTIDLIVFFIIFEILIFPIYKLILGWGSPGDQRLTAARSFVIYTVFGSILLLFVIVALVSLFGTSNILILYAYRNQIPDFLVIFMFLSFSTKIPTFPFYHWLTLAHVEASTVGSVILAALILKLGGYGFLRFLIPLFRGSDTYNYYYGTAIFIFIISMLFASICAVAQTDLKRIVAYSSIEHINLAIFGLIFSQQPMVNTGSYILIIAHGWVSAGLFFAVGSLYDQFHQRDILYYSGYSSINAWWSISFGLLLLANIGFPLTLNFFGEIQILIGVLGRHISILAFIFPTIIINVVYTFKLASILWGEPNTHLVNYSRFAWIKGAYPTYWKYRIEYIRHTLVFKFLPVSIILFLIYLVIITANYTYYPIFSRLIESNFIVNDFFSNSYYSVLSNHRWTAWSSLDETYFVN